MFILLLVVNSSVSAKQATRKVLILDIPRLTENEIVNSPVLRSFFANGATGIITTNLSDPINLSKIYYTFNSGTLLKTTEEINGQIYDTKEEFQKNSVAKIFYTYTGAHLPPSAAAHIGLGKLIQLNNSSNLEKIGLFGRSLHQAGLQTAAIGNLDAELLNRTSAAMLIDEKGRIDYGALGITTLAHDPKFPFGKRSDPEVILDKLDEFQKKAAVTLVTLGDFERIEAFRAYLSLARYQDYRQTVLQEYNQLLRKILNQVNRQETLVVLVSPLPPFEKYEPEARLGIVSLSGSVFKNGLLFSSSTRRTGLITLNDLPVTILDFLGVQQNYESGRVLKVKPGSFNNLLLDAPKLVENYKIRWPLLTTYVYSLIALIIVSILGLFFYHKKSLLYKISANLFLWLLTFPGVFLWESYYNPINYWSVLGITFGISALVYGVICFLAQSDFLKRLNLISIFILSSILCDGLLNGRAELTSFMGYSAVVGARFYGIGNEYLGLLLGSYFTVISLNFKWFKEKYSSLLWWFLLIITVLIAHPSFGANIGGGITALFGLGYATYLWLNRAVKLKEILRLAAAVIGLLVLIGLWDFYLSGNLITHFGQLLIALKNNGFGVLIELIIRKWGLNARLINFSIWTYILLAIMLSVPIIYRTQAKRLAWLFEKYPAIMQGFLGMTVTGIVALLVNDSGIVTLAMLFLFAIILLLLIIFKERSLSVEIIKN